MAVQQNFRSALNGFNREDVVHYIEYLNAKHIAEINQLKSELEFLRGKENGQQTPQAPAEEAAPEEEQIDPVIEQQAARIRELFDEKNELVKKLEALQQEKDALEARLNDATAEKNQTASRMEEELEAYRRAERTERLARERAEQMYRQANGALSDATVKVSDAADQIGELTDRVMEQLGQLQSAVTGSKQALRDAAATMYTIRPNTDEE